MYCQMNEVNQILKELELSMPAKSWEKTYSFRLLKFFNEYLAQEDQRDRRLMAITEKEVDYFIASLPYKHNEKVNYYSALKKFFDFAAKKDAVQPFFIKVRKYRSHEGIIKCIKTEHIKKLIGYINGDAEIESRLMIALLLYTGLSRKYISVLSFQLISDDMSYFRFGDGVSKVPIKDELIVLLNDYRIKSKKKYTERFFNGDETMINYEVKKVCESVCGCKYSPTEFSNTFISGALGEEGWTNLYPVSKMTLESISTIANI